MSIKSKHVIAKLLIVFLSVLNLNQAAAAPKVTALNISVKGAYVNFSWAVTGGKAKGYELEILDISKQTKKTIKTSLTFANASLNNFTKYSVRLRSSDINSNKWSAYKSFQTTSNAIASVDITNRSYTDVSISWPAVSGATSYILKFKSGAVKTSLKNSYNVTGLNPSSIDYVLITPAFGSLSGLTSNNFEIKTLTTGPEKPIATNVTSTSFTLSWNALSGASNYVVYANSVELAKTTSNTYSVINLTPGASKSYTVAAIINGGLTSQSEKIDVSTLSETALSPTVSAVDAASIKVEWTRNTNAKSYLISVYDSTGINSVKTETIDSSLNSYTVTGLAAATTYNVGIRYNYAESTSNISKLVSVITTKPAPTGLSTSGVTSTSLTLGWTSAPGAYQYDIFRDNVQISRVTDSTVNSVAYTSLIPGATYKYAIRAYYYDANKVSQVSELSPTYSVTMLTDPAFRPVSISAPVVTLPYANSPIVGATISTSNGAWTSSQNAPTFAVQWQRSTDNGTTWNDITGATSATYLVVNSDFGFRLRSKVTATNPNGSGVEYSAQSQIVGSVYNLSAPLIRGNIIVGQILEATDGSWASSYDITYTYQWQRSTDSVNWTSISGAISPTYTLTNSDIGNWINVKVTASTTLGNASVSSSPRGTVNVVGNTVLPVVSGPTRVGGTLSVTEGTWIGTPDSITYQWQSSSDGSLWDSISGATSSTYALKSAEAGKYVRVQVFGNKTVSSVAYKSTATTAKTALIPALTLINSTPPIVSGSWTEGSTLSASTGTWSANGTYTYQWQSSSNNSSWSNISGATNSTYLLTSSENGKYIRIQVFNSATSGDGIAYSSATLKVGAPYCTVQPVISGTLRVGSQQSVTDGTWSGSPTYSYQWQKSSDGIAWSNISSATANTYTPTFDVANLKVRVIVSAVNAVDTATATSNIITNFFPPVATAIPAISGTLTSGQTLTSSSGTWPNTSSGYTYQWQKSTDGTTWVEISGATASTYVLAASDVGYLIRSQVSLTTSVGTSTAYSLATTPIS